MANCGKAMHYPPSFASMPKMISSQAAWFLAKRALASVTMFSAQVLSLSPCALIKTLSQAPLTAVLIHRAPTPTSDRELGLPCSAICLRSGMHSKAVCMVRKGTSVAYFDAFWMACFLSDTCSGVSLGRAKAFMMASKARVSSSTRARSLSLSV